MGILTNMGKWITYHIQWVSAIGVVIICFTYIAVLIPLLLFMVLFWGGVLCIINAILGHIEGRDKL